MGSQAPFRSVCPHPVDHGAPLDLQDVYPIPEGRFAEDGRRLTVDAGHLHCEGRYADD